MADDRGVAIITGAGSGIGRAVGRAFLQEGWAVALAGRRADALEGTKAEAVGAAERALPVPTDVRDPSAVEGLFARTRERFGRVDLLFNNAGTNIPPTPIEDLEVEDWRSVIDTNLTGMFLCIRAAFRVMRDQQPRGGRIINNGSISAHMPRPHTVAYTAAKHAVTGLTRSTALDGRRYDIACGQIDIGNTATFMTSAMTDGVPQADGSLAPEPTFDVQHVVRAVLYMASLPLDANVLFMTVMATKMPYVGRG
jgi:NAD(P)-dependent dehydrogenase (short-subunit alcohol dehydrogenase family)